MIAVVCGLVFGIGLVLALSPWFTPAPSWKPWGPWKRVREDVARARVPGLTAAPWVVLLLLSGGGASASVWNSPGGIAVLCAGAGICVIAYLAMRVLSRLSTDPRNLGGAS